MISVYQTFKLILGIVVSIFILFFLINYAGLYAGFQTEADKVKAIQNFQKLSQDVYFTGNPAPFTDFGRAGFENMYIDISQPEGRGRLITDVGRPQFPVPTFLVPADKLFVGRGTMALGWWNYHYVVAMPEARIVFSPESEASTSWSIMQDITSLFPDSTNFEPKISFSVCEGSSILELGERYDALYLLEDSRPQVYGECYAPLGDSDILVIISQSCNQYFSRGDVCIKPSATGIGDAYVPGDDSTYKYHDALDLLALIVGSQSDETMFGKPWEKLWRYKNTEFAYQIRIASELRAQAAKTIGSKIGQIDINNPCVRYYNDLEGSLSLIGEILEDDDYYTNQGSLNSLSAELYSAREAYSNLVYEGCEYLI